MEVIRLGNTAIAADPSEDGTMVTLRLIQQDSARIIEYEFPMGDFTKLHDHTEAKAKARRGKHGGKNGGVLVPPTVSALRASGL